LINFYYSGIEKILQSNKSTASPGGEGGTQTGGGGCSGGGGSGGASSGGASSGGASNNAANSAEPQSLVAVDPTMLGLPEGTMIYHLIS